MAGAFSSDKNIGANGIAVRDRLETKNKKSRALSTRTGELMNMGSAASLEMPFPVLIENSDGPFLWDADGNRYIDYQIGFGAMVLGHKHPSIQTAIEDQVSNRGWHFGLHNPNQVPLAELLIQANNGVERVIFCNTGTEATMYAIRAARAFTGKWKLGVFDGFYHGAHDYGIGMAVPDSPRDKPAYMTMGAGVLPAVAEHQLMLPYRSTAAFDLIRTHKDELAMVMIEPSQSSNPHMNEEIHDFLHELAAVCDASNVLFMMDEVITGFRLAYGGAQEVYGLKPDLATYGKILGGGLPVGAVGGRADIMALFNAMGRDPRGIMSGGTFSGNPLTMAAGTAQVKYLDAHRDEVYPHIFRLGQKLADGINTHARDRNMAVQVLNAGPMFQIYFKADEIRSSRDLNLTKPPAETEFYLHLLDQGVLVPGTRRSFVSYAHTDDLIDETIGIVQSCLDLVRADGLL